jgi:hypothetical protein
MIHSTSSSGSAVGAAAALLSASKSAVRPQTPGQDSLSLGQADGLRHALASQEEIRPDMVEKGRALAADPNYPPSSVIRSLAQAILQSPDLSEDPS